MSSQVELEKTVGSVDLIDQTTRIDYSRTTDLCEIMARYGSDKGHP
jgi:hypothetical protein